MKKLRTPQKKFEYTRKIFNGFLDKLGMHERVFQLIYHTLRAYQ